MIYRRIAFTFGLRTLLIAFTVLALAIGWTVDRIHRRQVAIATIKSAGGYLRTECDIRRHSAVSRLPMHEPWPPFTRTWNERIFGDSLRSVSWLFSRTRKMSPDTLRAVASLHELKTLLLAGTDANDSDLVILCELKHLETLSLSFCPITDTSAKTLAEFPELQWLELEDTQITDAAVDDLLKLKNLQRLRIRGTLITDRGVARLRSLPNLIELSHGDSYYPKSANE